MLFEENKLKEREDTDRIGDKNEPDDFLVQLQGIPGTAELPRPQAVIHSKTRGKCTAHGKNELTMK